MPAPSLSSVRIRYFDRDAAWAAARDFAAALARRPEVERVVVFGSLVRGDAVPGSDVDFLVVLCESDRDFLARIPHYLPERFPIGVDMFPYTVAELESMLAEGNHFVRRALAEGVELYRRTDTERDVKGEPGDAS